MAEKIQIEDKLIPKSQTKVAFVSGGAINSPTPSWANWMFRVVVILTTVVAFWVSGTSLVEDHHKTEFMLALKTIDMLTLGFSKLFGIVEK